MIYLTKITYQEFIQIQIEMLMSMITLLIRQDTANHPLQLKQMCSK